MEFLHPSVLETVQSHCLRYTIKRRWYSNGEKSHYWISYKAYDDSLIVHYLKDGSGLPAMFKQLKDAKAFVEQHAREQE